MPTRESSKKNPDIGLQMLDRVTRLFAHLGWDTSAEIGNGTTIFSRFCEMLTLLDDDAERTLILEITHDFYWCTLSHYDRAVRESISALQSTLQITGRQIIAAPLLKLADRGKVKSAHLALYMFRVA